MMKYNIYYVTAKKNLIKENVTKEEARNYLKSLTMAEKTHIHIEEYVEREDEEER